MTTTLRERKLEQLRKEINAFSEFITLIGEKPQNVFQQEFYRRLDHIHGESQSLHPEERTELQDYFSFKCAKDLNQGNLIRHSFQKPQGYPGDFRIIDWIYTNQNGSLGDGKLWDDFFHRQAAPQSVRNRKRFLNYFWNNLVYEQEKAISVLNLASGPCRDLSDFLEQMNPIGFGSHFHCVDADPEAIEFAKRLTSRYEEKVTFTWELSNVFRFRTKEKFDLVWSSGLFDYLNDRLAIALIKKMWRWAKEGGKVVVGNFHPRNPSRSFMEWCGQWFLIHRTEDDYRRLCRSAGIPEESIQFDREPLGCCIFLILEKVSEGSVAPQVPKAVDSSKSA